MRSDFSLKSAVPLLLNVKKTAVLYLVRSEFTCLFLYLTYSYYYYYYYYIYRAMVLFSFLSFFFSMYLQFPFV